MADELPNTLRIALNNLQDEVDRAARLTQALLLAVEALDHEDGAPIAELALVVQERVGNCQAVVKALAADEDGECADVKPTVN